MVIITHPTHVLRVGRSYAIKFCLCLGDPTNDSNIYGDPFKTLFVARIVSVVLYPCRSNDTIIVYNVWFYKFPVSGAGSMGHGGYVPTPPLLQMARHREAQ